MPRDRHPSVADPAQVHRLESPRSYAQRQCRAAGIPFEDVERGLTSQTQPYIYCVWKDDSRGSGHRRGGPLDAPSDTSCGSGAASPSPTSPRCTPSGSSVGSAPRVIESNRFPTTARTGACGTRADGVDGAGQRSGNPTGGRVRRRPSEGGTRLPAHGRVGSCEHIGCTLEFGRWCGTMPGTHPVGSTRRATHRTAKRTKSAFVRSSTRELSPS